MIPSLRDGDRVHVTPFTANKTPLPDPGDLILFLSNGTPVVHRYAGFIHGHHTQSSDHTGLSGPIDLSDILGVVTERKRGDRVVRVALPLRWRIVRWLRRIRGEER